MRPGRVISIVGGGGRIGASLAFALMNANGVSKIQILDANEWLAEGEALDLSAAGAALGGVSVVPIGFEDLARSDVIVIAAGNWQQEQRKQANAVRLSRFAQLLGRLKEQDFKTETVFIVASEPVESFGPMLSAYLEWPSEQVLGIGTIVESIAFQSLLAAKLEVGVSEVQAMVCGSSEHLVPLWSQVRIKGRRVESTVQQSFKLHKKLDSKTASWKSELKRLKGGAQWTVVAAIVKVLDALQSEDPVVLPISYYGETSLTQRLSGITIPVCVTQGKATPDRKIALWPKEALALKKAAALSE